MTETERALLIAVARYVAGALDTPFATRRKLQELTSAVEAAAKEKPLSPEG